jgi:ferredoxin-NADP reductase
MLKYLVDTNDRRDIVLVYGERTLEELAYRDVLAAAAKQLGTRLVYTLSEPAPDWTGPKGRISAELVAQMIPDYHERLFYISGPQAMVQATRRTLHGLGVPAGHIRTDFFPGYA